MTDNDALNIEAGEQRLSIEEHSEALGIETPKMTPGEQARFWLAKWVLLSGAMLMILAWVMQFAVAMWGIPDVGDCANTTDQTDACSYAREMLESRTSAAGSIFEFAKTWIPPVITLVLGYYFARENDDSTE